MVVTSLSLVWGPLVLLESPCIPKQAPINVFQIRNGVPHHGRMGTKIMDSVTYRVVREIANANPVRERPRTSIQVHHEHTFKLPFRLRDASRQKTKSYLAGSKHAVWRASKYNYTHRNYGFIGIHYGEEDNETMMSNLTKMQLFVWCGFCWCGCKSRAVSNFDRSLTTYHDYK